MNVWTAIIKADSEIGADISQSCIKSGIIGVKGLKAIRTDDLEKIVIEPAVRKYAEDILDSDVENNERCALSICEMEIGNLIWAKNNTGCYSLGRVIGDYNPIEKNRKCEWYLIEQEDNEVNMFLEPTIVLPIIRVYEATHNSKEIIKLAKITYNKKSNTNTYNIV